GARVVVSRDHARHGGSVGGLLGGEVGGDAIVDDGVVVDLGGPDAGHGGVMLGHEMPLPVLHRGRVGVELVPGVGPGGGKAGLVPVVAGDRLVREGDDVATVGIGRILL